MNYKKKLFIKIFAIYLYTHNNVYIFINKIFRNLIVNLEYMEREKKEETCQRLKEK